MNDNDDHDNNNPMDDSANNTDTTCSSPPITSSSNITRALCIQEPPVSASSASSSASSPPACRKQQQQQQRDCTSSSTTKQMNNNDTNDVSSSSSSSSPINTTTTTITISILMRSILMEQNEDVECNEAEEENATTTRYCWISANLEDIQRALSQLAMQYGSGNDRLLPGILKILVETFTHYSTTPATTITSDGEETVTAVAVKLQTLLDFLSFCMPSFCTTTTKQNDEDDNDQLSDEAEEDEGLEQKEATLIHVLQTFEVLIKKAVITSPTTVDSCSTITNNNILLPLLLSNLIKLTWSMSSSTITARVMSLFFQNLSLVPNQYFPVLVHDLVTFLLPQLTSSSSSSSSSRRNVNMQQQQHHVALVTALRKEFSKRQQQQAMETAQQQEQQYLIHSAMILLTAILPQQQQSTVSYTSSPSPLQEFSSLYDYNNDYDVVTTRASQSPSSPVAKTYLHVLQKEITKRPQNNNAGDSSSSSSSTITLCILDVAIILALSSSLYNDDNETTMTLVAQSLVDAWCNNDDSSYCSSFFQHLQTLLQVPSFVKDAATITRPTTSHQELGSNHDDINGNDRDSSTAASVSVDDNVRSGDAFGSMATFKNVVYSIHDQVIQPSARKLAIFLCLTPTRQRQRNNNICSGDRGRIVRGGSNNNNNNLLLEQNVQKFWIHLYDALGNKGKHHHHDDIHDLGHQQQQHGLVRSLLQLLMMPVENDNTHQATAVAVGSIGNNTNNNVNNNNPAHHVWVYNILQDLILHNQWHSLLLTIATSTSRLNSGNSNDDDYYFASFVRQSLTQRFITMGGDVVHGNNDDDNSSSMAQLCSVLVLLWGAKGGMHLVQQLLFSSIGIRSNSNRNNPSLKGLLLAMAMVQSKCLRDKDMHDLKDWILRILLPVSRRMAEPELGSQGLTFLLAWNKQQQALLQHQHEKNGQDHDDAASSSRKKKTSNLSSSTNNQIFDDIKILLGNTGLVQTLAHYHQRGSSGRQSNSETTILGYRTTHKLFEDNVSNNNNNKSSSLAPQTTSKNTNNVAAAPDMVFCVAFFLRHMDSHEPSRWQHAARWVFDLVNTYLQIGRERAKSHWKPYGWLQATVEFPKLDFDFVGASTVTTKQKENVTSWLQLELFTFEVDKGENINEDASPSESKRTLCAELFTRDIDADRMARLRDSFYHYMFGLYIAIGLSSAVLKNVFAHFENLVSWSTSDNFSDESNSLLRLVACQILKLYDLRKKTTSTVLLLASLESALKRRRAKRVTTNSTAHHNADDAHSNDEVGLTLEEDALESALEVALDNFAVVRSEIALLEEVFFSSSQFIDERILWECLNNKSHNDLLRRNLMSLASSGSMSTNGDASQFSLVLDLNMRLVLHLSSASSRPEPFLLQYMANAVSTTLFLAETLPKIRSRTSVFSMDIPLSSIDKLTHSYLDLAVASLARCLDMGMGNVSIPEGSITRSCLEAVADVLQNDENNLQKCDNVFERITALLYDVDDFPIAGGLLDIMFLLTSSSGDEGWLAKVVEASFIALHMRYTQTDSCSCSSKLPFSVAEASRRSQASSDAQHTLHIALNLTIAKSSGTRCMSSGCFGIHRFNLMRHFGLLVMSHFDILEEHINHFIVELELLVGSRGSAKEQDWVDKRNLTESSKCKTLSPNIKADSPSCRSKSRKSVSPSRFKSKKTTTSAVACLDKDTFADFFEAILDMSVASCILLPPSTGSVEDSSRPCGPYFRFGAAAQFFRRLVKIYSDGFTGFPRKSIILVFQACRQMLDVMVSQLDQCVEWRNSQPLPKTSLTIAYDPGSMRYLGDLLDVLATCVVGSLFSLCQTWQNQSSVAHVVSRAKALRQLAEKARRTLVNVALAHKLPLPRFDREAEYIIEAATAAAAANNINGNNASSRTAEGEENEILDSPNLPTGKKRRRHRSSRLPMHLMMRSKLPNLEAKKSSSSPGKLNNDHDNADEAEEDDEDDDFVLNGDNDAEASSDDKEGSFNAMGDWGDDDDDDDNGADDLSASSSIEAPTISIQRVA